MDKQHPTDNFLLDTGYEFDEVLECYWFMHRDGDYAAVNRINLIDVIRMPLHLIKLDHERFLERAKEREEF